MRRTVFSRIVVRSIARIHVGKFDLIGFIEIDPWNGIILLRRIAGSNGFGVVVLRQRVISKRGVVLFVRDRVAGRGTHARKDLDFAAVGLPDRWLRAFLVRVAEEARAVRACRAGPAFRTVAEQAS